MNARKLAVVAVGGNSLILDPKKTGMQDQLHAARETARHIAGMIQGGWRVVVTHGNGPQVGFELLRSELASSQVPPVPMDACGAFTQGGIGYLIQQSLTNEFRLRRMPNKVATVVTQVRVDAEDPAFSKPTKPVGPFYDAAKAQSLQQESGWAMVEDSGRGWRRVVPSPEPREILEEDAIRALLETDTTVIAVGGGGVPVIETNTGEVEGVAAVIDKDLASSRLATRLKADMLLISTAVEQVAIHFNSPEQRNLERLSASEARRYADEGHFAPGSMGPKIQAALRFVENGGEQALITCPEAIARALKGETGTYLVPDAVAAAR